MSIVNEAREMLAQTDLYSRPGTFYVDGVEVPERVYRQVAALEAIAEDSYRYACEADMAWTWAGTLERAIRTALRELERVKADRGWIIEQILRSVLEEGNEVPEERRVRES